MALILGYFLTFGPESTRKLQAGFYQLISPFLTTGSGLEKQITSVRTGLKSLEELEKENAQLRVENRALNATNQALRDVEREVNRLRLALAYRERSVFKLVPAEIVARDSSTWWRTVTINRGKEDGIETDMSVVTDQGLVGKTTTVSEDFDRVVDLGRKLPRGGERGRNARAGDRLGRTRGGRADAIARSEFSFQAGEPEAGAKSLHFRSGRRFPFGSPDRAR